MDKDKSQMLAASSHRPSYPSLTNQDHSRSSTNMQTCRTGRQEESRAGAMRGGPRTHAPCRIRYPCGWSSAPHAWYSAEP